jgi:hypothetical protein
VNTIAASACFLESLAMGYFNTSGNYVLTGSGIYGFDVEIQNWDADTGIGDCVVRGSLVKPTPGAMVSGPTYSGVNATHWGDQADVDSGYDNGKTIIGIDTTDPECIGCALPIAGYRITRGTPLPVIPWHTPIHLFSLVNGLQMNVPLIDLGPSPPPLAHAGIDLTYKPYIYLAGSLNADLRLEYRVVGGAQWYPAAIKKLFAKAA